MGKNLPLLSIIHLLDQIIKRKVYMKAVNLILPFVENKRICNAEDLLSISVVYLFMKKFVCADFLGYFYYKNVPDSATKNGYNSNKQRKIQISYVHRLTRYFYARRNEIENCSLADFFFNSTENLKIYKKVNNVDKKLRKNCSNNIKGFHSVFIREKRFCVIMKQLI